MSTELVAAGRFFHERGWVPATGGNFSVRLPDGSIAITASGRHKGELVAADILRCDLDGKVIESSLKTSYETPLHLQVYRREFDAGAVLHTHSVANTVLSLRSPRGLKLRGYELLKVLPGIRSHDVEVLLPVFANDQDVPRLARQVDAYRQANPEMPPAYLIAGHGLYTWAPTLRQCRWQVEALEFIMACELQAGGG